MARPAFSVAGAVATGSGSVRVVFARYPLTADPNGVYDALNPSNYSVRGALAVRPVQVDVVPDHPDEVVVRLDRSMTEGSWTVVVGDVRTVGGRTLASSSVSFAVGKTFDVSSRGEVFQSLVRDFHPKFRHGRNWRALLTAVTTGDRANRELARAAFDQMFVSSASGKYLDDHGARSHVRRPVEVGMSDDDYRRLLVALDSRRVVPDLLRELLEIFYGEASVRPVLRSVTGPFSFSAGDDVVFETPSGQVRTVVSAADFTDLTDASPEEVAAWLNRWFTDLSSPLRAHPASVEGSAELAVSVVGTRDSWLSVVGGTGQRTLRFPAELPAYTSGSMPMWTIGNMTATGRTRFTTTSSSYDLSSIRVGDYVVVSGTEFNSLNRGSREVVTVRRTVSGGTTTQYFEVSGAAFGQMVVQLEERSLKFFRPTRVSPSDAATVDRASERICLPAVTSVVRRRLGTAQYLDDNAAVEPTSVLRTADGRTSVEEVDHGLSVGDQVEFEGLRSSASVPATVAGDVVGPPLLTSARPVTHWAVLKAPGRALVDHTVTAVGDVALVAGGYDGAAHLDTCSVFEIVSEAEVAPDARQFTYTWTSTAALPAERSRHRALAPTHPQLRGAVVVCGGYDGSALDTCYRYDFDTDTWLTLDSMGTARYWHELVELADGRILAIGGFGAGGAPISSVEVYDPSTDTWSSAGSLNFGRARFAAAVDSDGTVVVSGGLDASVALTSTCERYDPNTDTWTRIGNSSLSRYDARAVVHDSRIYVAGGTGYLPRDGAGPVSRREVEALELNGSWVPANLLPRARGGLGAAAVGSSVYVWGGGAADVDRGEGSRWTRSRATATAYDRSSWCVLESGVVLDVGGLVSTTQQDRAALLVPAAESWTGRGVNGVFRVAEVVDDDNFVLDGESGYVSATPGTYRNLAADDRIGSRYVPSPDGPSPTSTASTLSVAIPADVLTGTLSLSSATSFPDEGWVVLDLGTSRQLVAEYRSKTADVLNLVRPIRSDDGLAVGTDIRLMVGKGSADIPVVATVLTASEAGLRMLLDLLDDSEAGGCELEREVGYPGDRGLGGEGRTDVDSVVVWG